MKPFAALLVVIMGFALGGLGPEGDDVADVPSERRTVGDDVNKSYFLIPQANAACPPKGCALLVVLPGGDGSASFHPFIKRVRKYALSDDFIIAQPIAVKWSPQQQIVWPTANNPVTGQKFTTEQFVLDVIADVQKQRSIDPERIYCMGWSSGGPAVYSLALQKTTPITGFYVSMSVYKPAQLPPVADGKGRSIYIEHSPQDKVCPFGMAQQAQSELTAAGAKVTLQTCQGGHGWVGNVWGRISGAIKWLENPG
jgi:poly(3-hydroxybutyrate) depolymerase